MYQLIGKRVFDLAASILILPLALPLVLVIAGVIAVTMGLPILFRQTRPGHRCRPFQIIKFRTMTYGRGEHGELLSDEGRMTALGRLLRRTSLDELPELINVLRGEMSLIGPRPLLTQYLERYTAEQARRHEVRPGITGWAQVNGRNAISWEQKLELDVWYADNCSLWLDLRILAMTVWQVVAGNGISAKGHATMPEFMGTKTSDRTE
jgi:lipopolysaccharide/colanic/teichoic acid biosynthesis glycosyltransferase